MGRQDEARGQEFTLEARDGYPLAATFYAPQGEARAAVLVLPGTGIPRGFYQGFCAWLVREGFAALALDYRGVAGSRPRSLRGFRATKQDWARLDMSAALDALARRAPGAPLWALGHSVGGQLIGLLDNHQALQGVVTVGTSFGYWGYMPGLYRWFVFGVWYGVVPVMTGLTGYLPARRMGLGEDLPAGVAREWARWGKRRDYFTEELSQEPGFRGLELPWKAILMKDDKIATRRNAEPLYALYPRIKLELEELDPAQEGFPSIGHLGFFSRTRSALWPKVTDFIGSHQGQAAPSRQRVS